MVFPCVEFFTVTGQTGGQTDGRQNVILEKTGVATMASAAGHCSRENPAWPTYAASGNIAESLKTHMDVL